jgi:hypothetical protein
MERQWFATEYERIVNENISDDDKRTYARLMRSSQVNCCTFIFTMFNKHGSRISTTFSASNLQL